MNQTADLPPLSHLLDRTGPKRQPDFLGIGSEKCGTTWLWDRLREHPEIGLPAPKELRYFATRYIGTQPITQALERFLAERRAVLPPRQVEMVRNELRILNGTDESYLRIFGGYRDKRVVGEVSPQYCILPEEGVAHVARLCPGAKIILLLRDPVQRIISGAKMKASEGVEELTEARVWQHLNVPIQARLSRYSRMIETWRAHVPEERMFVGFIDDIYADPKAMIGRVLAFLGLPPAPEGVMAFDKKSNEGTSFKVGPGLEKRAYALLRDEYDALAPLFPERVAAWRARYES